MSPTNLDSVKILDGSIMKKKKEARDDDDPLAIVRRDDHLFRDGTLLII